jgi:rhodanese-related sulfurtransferase
VRRKFVMKKIFTTAFILVLLSLLVACGGDTPVVTESQGVFYEEGMRWMSFEEFSSRMSSSEDMFLLDIRNEENWANVRIEGSINTHAMNYMGDDEEQAFLDAIMPALAQAEGRSVIVLCNSGSSGVRATWNRLNDVGFDMDTVYLLVGGVNDLQSDAGSFVIRD